MDYDNTDRGSFFKPRADESLLVQGKLNSEGSEYRIAIVKASLPDGGTAGAIIGGLMGHQNSDAKGGTRTHCRTETRYNEEKATIYSYSTIKFWHDGRELTVRFQK